MYRDKLKRLGFLPIENFTNVFHKSNNDIDYSDGEVELKILEILIKLKNNNSLNYSSTEEYIIDWPTEYHFSWLRQNIVKPIMFETSDTVLELGGGTGIITEYVSRKVEKVISIEGTTIRAKCIATRCSKYNNVEVIVGNFLNIDLLEIFGQSSFSKILLIGVLEYVPKYSSEDSEDPINKLLSVCNKLLKPNGKLVIAIENKIGLKYLLGREEDHLGIKHYGTQSLYKKNDPITFTKVEINNKLKSQGFNFIENYCPFPDYKLPNLIIKDSNEIKNKKTQILISSLLENTRSVNYSGRPAELLLEGRIWNNILNDNILGNLSNSFLIVASAEPYLELNNPFIYYFSAQRRYDFSNEIKFYYKKKSIIVKKKWNSKKTKKNTIIKLNNTDVKTYNYIEGTLLSSVLEESFLLDNKTEYSVFIKQWLQLLLQKYDSFEYTFDLLPRNIVIKNDGKLEFFDTDEWETKKRLSILQIIKRFVLTNQGQMVWFFNEMETNEEYILALMEFASLGVDNEMDDKLVNEIHKFVKEEIFFKEYKTKYLNIKNAHPKSNNKSKNHIKSIIKDFIPPILLKFKNK